MDRDFLYLMNYYRTGIVRLEIYGESLYQNSQVGFVTIWILRAYTGNKKIMVHVKYLDYCLEIFVYFKSIGWNYTIYEELTN